MTFRAKYTDAQRQDALRLVDDLERTTGKRRGTVAAAAAQLGLHPSIVAHWVAVARTKKDGSSTSNAERVPGPRGLAGLLWCEWCERVMVRSRTRDGLAAFACAGPCARKSVVLAAEVEHVIGQMILNRLSPAGRPALHQLTVPGAAEQAPRFLDRIVVGSRPSSVRVQWRLAPLPPEAGAGPPPAQPR